MTVNELISRIEHNIIAWHMMVSPSPALRAIQPDDGMIDEARSECFRAIYDTIREFEAECVSLGFHNAVKEFEKIADSDSIDPVSDFLATFEQGYR